MHHNYCFEYKYMSQKSLVLMALAILALALYAAGLPTATFVLFGLAAVIELWFWIKVFRSDKPKEKNHSDQS